MGTNEWCASNLKSHGAYPYCFHERGRANQTRYENKYLRHAGAGAHNSVGPQRPQPE